MIIDTHVHYGGTASQFKVHSAKELIEIAAAAGVDGIVQVTIGSSVGTTVGPEVLEIETNKSVEEALIHPNVTAVFGLVDEYAEDAIAKLDAMMQKPLVIGFRITSGNLPGTQPILEDPPVVALLTAAERIGAAVQIFAPFQIRQMHDIAMRHRGLRILVDHMGLRFSESGDNKTIFREWPAMMRLAEEPNVWTKVSYFPEAGSAFDPYPYPTAQRHFKQLYEHAGPRRLMWGSNFPPVTRVCTYKESLDFVREHCSFLKAADRDAILGGNFVRDFAPKR